MRCFSPSCCVTPRQCSVFSNYSSIRAGAFHLILMRFIPFQIISICFMSLPFSLNSNVCSVWTLTCSEVSSGHPLLDCDAMYWPDRIPTFRTTFLPPCAGLTEWGLEVDTYGTGSTRGSRLSSEPIRGGEGCFQCQGIEREQRKKRESKGCSKTGQYRRTVEWRGSKEMGAFCNGEDSSRGLLGCDAV
jgi:hypothetical protein